MYARNSASFLSGSSSKQRTVVKYRVECRAQTCHRHDACGWTVTATGPSVQCWVTSCGICAGRSDSAVGVFFLEFLRFFFASRRPVIDPRSSIIAS